MFSKIGDTQSRGDIRLTARISLTKTKEVHNGRQRRQKGQREGPETEGNQTGKRYKREEGQTTEKPNEIGSRIQPRGELETHPFS